MSPIATDLPTDPAKAANSLDPVTIDNETIDTATIDTGTINNETIELPPSFVLPTGLAAIALPLLGVSLWLGLAVALFAAFLLVQAATLRLVFTASDLDIYRGDRRIRRFPYRDWQNWDIFWYYLPTLFYFKETRSLHFLPILFDPTLLRACLEAKRLPVRRSWQ